MLVGVFVSYRYPRGLHQIAVAAGRAAFLQRLQQLRRKQAATGRCFLGRLVVHGSSELHVFADFNLYPTAIFEGVEALVVAEVFLQWNLLI